MGKLQTQKSETEKIKDRRTKDTGPVFAHDFINDTVSVDQGSSALHSPFPFSITFHAFRF